MPPKGKKSGGAKKKVGNAVKKSASATAVNVGKKDKGKGGKGERQNNHVSVYVLK